VRLVFAVLVLLAVAAAGLVLGPRLLDLSAYRTTLAGQLTVLAGRPMEIAGPVGLVLLPRPAVYLADVRASDGSFTAERIEIDPRWSALLTGQAEIRRLRLLGAVGRWNAFPASAGRLPLEEVSMAGSRFSLGDGAVVEVRAARLRQASSGALTLDAQVRLDGRDIGVDAVLDVGQPAPLNGRLTLPGNGELIFTGALGADRVFRGRVDGKGNDLGGIVAGIVLLPSGLAWQVGGTAELSAGRVALNDLRLVLADGTASGALAYEGGGARPRFDLALQLNRIDVDRLVAALPSWPTGFGLPAAGNVDIGVAAATWRGGIVQQIRLEAGFAGGGFDINRLSMLLPGAADLNLSGRLTGPDNARRFAGRLDAAADNLRAMLEWLGADVSSVASDRLRRLQFTAGVELEGGVIDFTDLELRLDSSRLTGVAAVALRARPSFSFDLDIDLLNVDGYWPRLDWAGTDVKSPLALLNRFDSNMKLTVARFTLDRMAGEGAVFDAQLFAGTLKIGGFRIADLEGSRVALAGEVRIAASGAAIYKLKLDAGGRDLANAARHLGVNWSGEAGKFAFTAEIDGDPQQVSLPAVTLDIGGESVDGSGAIRLDATPPTIKLDLSGRGAAIRRIDKILSLPQDFKWAGEAHLVGGEASPRTVRFGAVRP